MTQTEIILQPLESVFFDSWENQTHAILKEDAKKAMRETAIRFSIWIADNAEYTSQGHYRLLSTPYSAFESLTIQQLFEIFNQPVSDCNGKEESK